MNNNYVCIQSWMVTELGLKGNELLVYAIIYGFCQDGAHHFKGSRSYLAEWTNSTVRNVQTMLNKLVEKGLLAKEEKLTENNVRQCEYFPVNLPWEKSEVENKVPETEVVSGDEGSDIDGENTSPVVKNFHGGSEKISPGVVKNFHRGGEKISPNNIDNNIRDNIKDTSSSSEPPQKSDGRKDREVEQVVASWNSLSEFGIKSISKLVPDSERYKMLQARIRQYGLEAVLTAIENIKRSAFLCGSGKKGWTIKFDWFVRPNNFPKVLEGNYDDVEEHRSDAGKERSGKYDRAEDESTEWLAAVRRSQEEYRKRREKDGGSLPDLREQRMDCDAG